MAYATVQDLEDRIGPLTPEQAARAPALLQGASDRVESWTGQSFEPVEDAVVDLKQVKGVLWLPKRPATGVTSVAEIDRDGNVSGPVGYWCWDGEQKIDLWTGRGRSYGLGDVLHSWPGWPQPVCGPWCTRWRVVYDYGWPAVPGVIVDVVCSMVARTLTAPTQAEGVTGETIGQYSWQGQQAAGSAGAAVRLNRMDKEDLARFRQSLSTVAMSGRRR